MWLKNHDQGEQATAERASDFPRPGLFIAPNWTAPKGEIPSLPSHPPGMLVQANSCSMSNHAFLGKGIEKYQAKAIKAFHGEESWKPSI